CPSQRDPLRIFYESTREQIPTSEMAEIWLMEHGLLPEDEAKAAFDKRNQQKKSKQPSTPVKGASTSTPSEEDDEDNAPVASRGAKAKAKAKKEEESDDDD
ncbi:hypothetical protein SELMODRAFT_59603, partial [Selaginella moellendorffii]